LIYRGNFANWINPTWRELVLNTVGQARPRDWWVYEEHDLNIKISPPWCTGKTEWWITKLMPGQFMPMHTDPFTHYETCKRYWVPLQDYQPGHLFVYGNLVLTKYSAGDVYEYINSQDIHGAANIGHMPRVVLQVTEYE